MEFIDIKNIQRKDSPIHYINEYHCDLIYKTAGSLHEALIEVVIEQNAFGAHDFQIHHIEGEVDFNTPEFVSFIKEKYKQGYFVE